METPLRHKVDIDVVENAFADLLPGDTKNQFVRTFRLYRMQEHLEEVPMDSDEAIRRLRDFAALCEDVDWHLTLLLIQSLRPQKLWLREAEDEAWLLAAPECSEATERERLCDEPDAFTMHKLALEENGKEEGTSVP